MKIEERRIKKHNEESRSEMENGRREPINREVALLGRALCSPIIAYFSFVSMASEFS